MKRYIFTISILILIIYSCRCDNKTNTKIKSSNDTYRKNKDTNIDNYLSSSSVDFFPVLNYKNLKRSILPCRLRVGQVNKLVRDSLLSVFLEDNISRPVECEGFFNYTIFLSIDNYGYIRDIKFERDEYNVNELKKSIESELYKIKLLPAKKNGVNVPIQLCVNVYLDLYSPQSEINKKLFDILK